MLGNLCLTGYNPELSNKDFKDKKVFYENSAFHYTKEIAKQCEWTSLEIEARTTELTNIACRLWPLPSAYDNGNKAVPGKWYPLGTDPFAFRGMKPSRISFLGKEKALGSWVDFLIEIVAMSHDTDATVLGTFAKTQTLGNAIWMSTDPSILLQPKSVPGTPYHLSFGVDSVRIISRAQELADAYWQAIGVDLRQEIQIQVKFPTSRYK